MAEYAQPDHFSEFRWNGVADQPPYRFFVNRLSWRNELVVFREAL